MWEWNSGDRVAFKDDLKASLLTVCCFTLSWESGCKLVASPDGFIYLCYIWTVEFLRFGKTIHGQTGSQSRTVLSRKTSGSFRAVKKAADTEFAGDDSAILISVCVSVSLRFRFPTWRWKFFEISPSTCSHRSGFLFTDVRRWMIFSNKTLKFQKKGTTNML